ncbi:ThuA domain-containing protein [Arenicella sp. 4NH20-0111]|uniref:ThuA domain-containing protein n=1 Tax=Arenicella sp. 4NH20-0111 TaxID=3127648 RepID=UPI0031097F06
MMKQLSVYKIFIGVALYAVISTPNLGFAADRQFKVMLFTKTAGWHHQSLIEGVTAMRRMAEKHHFDLDWHEDANHFSEESLAKYDAVVFLLTTGDVLNETQQQALRGFIQSGKGFVGVHSASDTEKDWPWYTKLVGRTFKIHPLIQTAKMAVLQRSFPGLERMPDSLLWTDEWYDFGPENVEGLNYLLSVDESSYDTKSDWGDKKGDGMGSFHPVAWYHEFDGGRSFYTSLGHLPAVYKNELFLDHLFGGVYWAATGKAKNTQ